MAQSEHYQAGLAKGDCWKLSRAPEVPGAPSLPGRGSDTQYTSSCETSTRCPFPCFQQRQVLGAGAREQEGRGNGEVAIAMETRQSEYGWEACGLGYLVPGPLRSKGSILHPCAAGNPPWSQESQGVAPACGLRLEHGRPGYTSEKPPVPSEIRELCFLGQAWGLTYGEPGRREPGRTEGQVSVAS